MQIPQWVSSLQRQIEVRLEQQQQRTRNDSGVAAAVTGLQWPEWNWKWRWPWQGRKGSSSQRETEEEYKKKLAALCSAVKAENVTDLQDVLGAMALSECVYKRPDSEVIRSLNKFKADFGGQLVSVNGVQASMDHVPHRYLLAEAGNTLFVSFIGTKQLQDVVADANFLQRAVFGGEDSDGETFESEEQQKVGVDGNSAVIAQQSPGSNGVRKGLGLNNSELPPRPVKAGKVRPAAHRGFLARAKGVPATELYRLAQRKDRRLVLCGHSLGGAVAVLATLAILKAFATTSASRAANKVQVKCITFSQPPVGNAALRDYVHKKGWQHHFRTYCIPEDVIPRILSPAYFQHYRSQIVKPLALAQESNGPKGEKEKRQSSQVVKEGDKEGSQVVGVAFRPNPFWRISRLAPLAGVQTSFAWMKAKHKEDDNGELDTPISREGDVAIAAGSSQPLEIHEASEGVALAQAEAKLPPVNGKIELKPGGVAAEWLERVPSLPSLPSYVPFGQLYLLEKLTVQQLSAMEYTQLTSVQSVLLELKDRFHSHSMKSYRFRFQQIFNLCMSNDVSISNNENFPLLPHLQQWLSSLGGQLAEVIRISDPITIKLATAMVPLGWTGSIGEKKGCQPLKVDILGHGLHLCTLVRARVNGRWCATSIEIPPPPPFLDIGRQSKLQRMRIRIGDPLQQSTSEQERLALSTSEATIREMHDEPSSSLCDMGDFGRGSSSCEVDGLGEVTIFCSTDFMTTSREVAMRLRRVRLLGFEGAGKTSLYFALLGGEGMMLGHNFGGVLPDLDWREGVVGGVSYIDGPGANLQDLPGDAERLQKDLAVKVGPNSKKLDLVVLVHNLAHKIPQMRASSRPALALLMDEVAASGVPFILAITNKFAVSADRRQLATMGVMETYQVPPNLTVVINSCPHVVHGVVADTPDEKQGPGWQPQRLISGSMNLVQRPFRKKEVVQPTQGVENLQALVHSVLLEQEEAAMKEFSRQTLAYETAKEMAQATIEINKHGKFAGATTAAGIGAGFGLIVAVLIGAANSLRKP